MAFYVGYVHNGCGNDTVPPLPPGLSYGLQCTIGVDCPDCIAYNVLNSAGLNFDSFVLVDGTHFIGSLMHGSCTDTIPGEIVDFSATDGEFEQVTCTWSPAGGSPAPKYNVYRSGSLVGDNVSSGFVDTFTGTADYYVTATNVSGTVVGNTDSGTGVDTVSLPSKILDFNASDNLIGAVNCTWSSSIGNPSPTYNLDRGGVIVGTDITSPYSDTFTGTDDYSIKAINSEGSTVSNIDSGTGHASVEYQGFIVGVASSSERQSFVDSGSNVFVVLV